MKPLPDLSDDELLRALGPALALPDAPAAWQQAAIALWAQHTQPATPGLRDRLAQALAPLRASLRFDSAALPGLALGMRSASTDARQLLFGAGEHDIDLRLSVEGESHRLAGQVLGPQASGSVELAAADGAAPLRTATLDELGGFELAELPPGRYVLTLRLAATSLELPPIELGGPAA